MRRNTLQESVSQNFQESIPPNDDDLFYVLPNDEFRERSDQSFMKTRKDTPQFAVYPLSSLVDQWVRLFLRISIGIRDIKACLDRTESSLKQQKVR